LGIVARRRRVRPQNVLSQKRFNDRRFHSSAKDNALRMKMVISRELKDAALLNLDVNYGLRHRSSDRRHDGSAHGWFQRHDYKGLLWPPGVSLQDNCLFFGSSEAPTMLDSFSPRSRPRMTCGRLLLILPWLPAKEGVCRAARIYSLFPCENLTTAIQSDSAGKASSAHSPLTTRYSLPSTNISFAPRRDGGRLHNWNCGGKK
jgi:hypothetical protein